MCRFFAALLLFAAKVLHTDSWHTAVAVCRTLPANGAGRNLHTLRKDNKELTMNILVINGSRSDKGQTAQAAGAAVTWPLLATAGHCWPMP